MFQGRNVLGTQRPRNTTSQGHNVPETHHPWDATLQGRKVQGRNVMVRLSAKINTVIRALNLPV
jgi:hypothetical protein